MSVNMFGDHFKAKRMALGKTLRQFCLENKLDPGNISKLERGLLPPPGSIEKLEEFAKLLNIQIGSDEWIEFKDKADAMLGKVPNEILSDDELLQKLPLVFRTLRGQQLTIEQLERLANELRNV